MGRLTLQDICCEASPDYECSPPLPAHVRRAAHAIIQCRTAVLGGHSQACPDGHVSRVWDNSCRQRACPQCAYRQTERWLALQRARLLACDPSQGIFPLPHDLNPLWLANVPVRSTLRLQAARDTFGELLADAKYLGAQPGSIAAWHPWSQPLVVHPHLHGFVTGGGLPPDGHWQAVRHGVLLPVRVVMAGLRGTRLGALWQALGRAALVLPEATRPHQVRNLCHRLGHAQKTPWNVPLRERYHHGVGVVTYLAR